MNLWLLATCGNHQPGPRLGAGSLPALTHGAFRITHGNPESEGGLAPTAEAKQADPWASVPINARESPRDHWGFWALQWDFQALEDCRLMFQSF